MVSPQNKFSHHKDEFFNSADPPFLSQEGGQTNTSKLGRETKLFPPPFSRILGIVFLALLSSLKVLGPIAIPTTLVFL